METSAKEVRRMRVERRSEVVWVGSAVCNDVRFTSYMSHQARLTRLLQGNAYSVRSEASLDEPQAVSSRTNTKHKIAQVRCCHWWAARRDLPKDLEVEPSTGCRPSTLGQALENQHICTVPLNARSIRCNTFAILCNA